MSGAHQTANVSFSYLRVWWRQGWPLALLLAAATMLAYQPAWHAGFIWDDDYHLTQNPCVVGPLGFKAIWTSSAAVYYPLVLTSFWVQHALWGLEPLPYHLVNIILHAACALLFWRLLLRLKVRGAWFGAALWALHPVQVESAAWITELKNTQSCLFYLLAILCFMKWLAAGPLMDRRGRERDYALALLCAMLAILSKASTVMLPVVLGLCWWWMERGWRWRNALRLAPFFVISAAASGWTIWEQQFHSGALGTEWAQTWPERLVISGRAVWFYLGKLLWPYPLTFIYPRWAIDASRPAAYLPVLGVLACLLALWRSRQGRMRPLFFAFAYFLISLFPVLGFFNVYFFRYSFVSDHFQYLASLGPLALAAAGLTTAFGLLGGSSRFLRPALCGMLLLGLGGLSWQQSQMYHDMETLWRTTLARNPNAVMAHNNLGLAVLEKGQVDEAVAHFQKALAIDPAFYDAHNSLGLVLLQQGRAKEAIARFQEAVKLRPDFAAAYNNLGNALRQDGQADAAVSHFRKALEINPRFALAFYNLGNGLLEQGRTDEAIAYFRKALEIQPSYPEAHYNLGIALFRKGRIDEAIMHLQQAVEFRPNFAAAHNNLGNLLLQTGRLDQAIVHYTRALEGDPTNAPAHINLGGALLQAGRVDEAIVQFQSAAQLLPASAEAQNNLANALIRAGRVDEAKACLLKALELRPDFAQAHNNLGLLLLRAGQIEEAITHFERALAIQPNNAPAHRHLAQALAQAARTSEAVEHYRAALAVQPGDVPTLNNLAWILATSSQASLRDGAKAIELAQQADRLSKGTNASILGTLAAAYAEAGRFDEAVAAAQQALALTSSTQNDALAKGLQGRLNDYKAGRPHRE